jgi:hypothetical protein
MRAVAVLVCAFCMGAPALAQENGDLDRIPQAIQNEPSAPVAIAPPPAAHGKYYVENDFALSSTRDNLVVATPLPPSSDWANRTSLDAFDQWNMGAGLTFNFSDRFSLTEDDGMIFPAKSMRNALREAYFSWEPVTATFVEFGRINLKNGVALGFNPTDFFKANTAVSQASADPSALRGDRLGTLMLRTQTIWDGGSATFVYAPKVHKPRALDAAAPNALDPSFDQTNAADRFMLAVNLEFADLSPQALLYSEAGRTKAGLNISYPIGQSIIAYGEWAGGRAPDLIAEAIAFGKATGTLPDFAPVVPPTDTSRKFQSDLAIGASWTSIEKVTLNLEYHFHQGGLSGADWRNWFAIGGANTTLAPELWYMRDYASVQQQPMSQHQIFMRADWQDAFVQNLEISGISFVNLTDGSGMVQLAANYNLSDAWSLGAYAGGTFGGKRSEWGSLPNAASAIFQVQRYF